MASPVNESVPAPSAAASPTAPSTSISVPAVTVRLVRAVVSPIAFENVTVSPALTVSVWPPSMVLSKFTSPLRLETMDAPSSVNTLFTSTLPFPAVALPASVRVVVPVRLTVSPETSLLRSRIPAEISVAVPFAFASPSICTSVSLSSVRSVPALRSPVTVNVPVTSVSTVIAPVVVTLPPNVTSVASSMSMLVTSASARSTVVWALIVRLLPARSPSATVEPAASSVSMSTVPATSVVRPTPVRSTVSATRLPSRAAAFALMSRASRRVPVPSPSANTVPLSAVNVRSRVVNAASLSTAAFRSMFPLVAVNVSAPAVSVTAELIVRS